jgi:hypothetical protein
MFITILVWSAILTKLCIDVKDTFTLMNPQERKSNKNSKLKVPLEFIKESNVLFFKEKKIQLFFDLPEVCF